MRKLAIACLAFSAAVFAANYVIPAGWLPYLAVVFAASGAALIAMKRKWLKGVIIALIAFSAGLSCFYLHYLRYTVPARGLHGQTREISGKLLEYPQVYDDYCRARILVDCEGAPRFGALVYDNSMALAEAEPGQIISFSGKISSADTRYGEAYGYYNSRDIYLTISAKSELSIAEGGFDLRLIPVKLSALISRRTEKIFPLDTAAFMKSLMLGDKTELYEDAGLHMAMSRAGFMHVVAVSGMHIAFLVGFLQLIFGSTRRNSLICIMLVWLFVLVTGAGPAAVRAGVMQSFLLFAPIVRRENDPLTSLAASLALILLSNPYAAASVSLQLSFGAMAGMMCFSERFTLAMTDRLPKNLFGRGLKYLLGIAAASFSVMVFTLPLMALHFGYVSLLSPLANMLGLWAVSLCFCGGYLACALSVLFPALGAAAAAVISLPARYIFFISRLVSSLPFAAVYMRNGFAACWLGLSYVLFGAAALRRDGGGKRFLLPAALTIFTLVMTLGLAKLNYRSGSGIITALDVGQGQCISVFAGDKTMLIDCGGTGTLDRAGETAGAYLSSCGRDRVDILLLTHLHADHANGVAELLELIDVERIILPAEPDDEDGLLDEIIKSAEKHGARLEYLSADAEIELGEINARLFAPGEAGDTNERCIMALVSVKDYDMLITGDGSKSAERALVSERELENIELLIVGHHGSRYSSCGELLGSIGGEDAIVSVGYNTYGHPTYETLERLDAYGYNIYRTDLNGTIEIRIGKNYGQEKQQGR